MSFCDQSGAGDDRLQYSCQQLDYGSFVVFTILIYFTFKDAKWLDGLLEKVIVVKQTGNNDK